MKPLSLDSRLMLIFGAILIVCWFFPILIYFFVFVDLLIIFYLLRHKFNKVNYDKVLSDVIKKLK